MYPTISEYLEAIKAAEDNFEQLKNLRPVLDEEGNPIYYSQFLLSVDSGECTSAGSRNTQGCQQAHFETYLETDDHYARDLQEPTP